MRRKEREMTQVEEILQVLADCQVMRMAVQDQEGLYIVPLNFAYEYVAGKLALYFHSGKAGRKVEALAADNRVAFEVDCGHGLVVGQMPCTYGYTFRSVVGSGRAVLLETAAEQARALNLLMLRTAGKEFAFTEQMLDTVRVYKIEVEEFCGKRKLE